MLTNHFGKYYLSGSRHGESGHVTNVKITVDYEGVTIVFDTEANPPDSITLDVSCGEISISADVYRQCSESLTGDMSRYTYQSGAK